jgi:hypothetical protein
MQDRGREESKIRDSARDVHPPRERNRLAVVVAFESRQLFEILFDEIGELQQDARAIFRARRRP